MKKLALMVVYTYTNVWEYVSDWGWFMWTVFGGGTIKVLGLIHPLKFRILAYLGVFVFIPLLILFILENNSPGNFKKLRVKAEPLVKFLGLYETAKKLYPQTVKKAGRSVRTKSVEQ